MMAIFIYLSVRLWSEPCIFAIFKSTIFQFRILTEDYV
jgi:hypothetical protein